MKWGEKTQQQQQKLIKLIILTAFSWSRFNIFHDFISSNIVESYYLFGVCVWHESEIICIQSGRTIDLWTEYHKAERTFTPNRTKKKKITSKTQNLIHSRSGGSHI